MEDTSRVYRIRTKVGDEAPNVIHVPLNQTYDMFEILSLKLNQSNSYKTYDSDYGVVVGRVQANGGFGIENAKISVFIPVSEDDMLKDKLLYNFTSVNSKDDKGIRYNLLPDYVDDACHQDVGTFPNKRLVLDNNNVLEMFDKYWKYTTTTNHAGDYMLFGVPVGSQQLHVDVDLSDCGILSQRPRNMIAKGYNATMFESPNKFKSSTNLNSLVQIVSQDKGIYVYPYWGDVSDGDEKFSITRCDINLEYQFEPTAVFMGSIVTDKGSNAIGKNCTSTEKNGKMSDLIAGEGTIEMIRKTLDGKVEEYPIMGNRLIDGDGVWAYDIPMNLDYVTTDEFGNLIPTDNPSKGIPTRTRVRFRISLDENPNDATARKRAKYLVPNNPRMGEGEFDDILEPDYEFGSATREESYCDMFWNKVYTVKNYIPKLQKNSKETNRKHTGIKLINHYGDNNPMPYNALTIKLSFTYRLICVIVKIFIKLVGFLNNIISILAALPCWLYSVKILGWRPFKFAKKLIPSCIELSSEFCDDGINPNVYFPGCGKPKLFACVWTKITRPNCQKEQAAKAREDQKVCKNSSAELITCVENELAQQNDATSFNFYNDWLNGTLYAPLWYRKITPKKTFFFGLFKRKAKDEWCSANREFAGLRIMQACAVKKDKVEQQKYYNFEHTVQIEPYYVKKNDCGNECHKKLAVVQGLNGVIQTKETMLGHTVYYYTPVEYDVTLNKNENLVGEHPKGDIKLLFATDIILLGSLNECDMNGIPQFFKTLESTTYNMPSDILFNDYDIQNTFDADGNFKEAEYIVSSEMAGCDWGNKNEYGKYDGGLFYSIGCSSIELTGKSCINLSRICEYGVSLDETKQIANLNNISNDGDNAFESLITDGFISWDELYNLDERSMFATMNGNKLKTKLNVKNGLKEYDFRYLYPDNFDGSLEQIMRDTTNRYNSNVTYKNNYKLETFSQDYYKFRMGNAPYFYDNDHRFPRYENSFYFYFGLKAGKTAIEKFNSKYFAECNNETSVQSQIGIKSQANSWCSELNTTDDNYNGYDGYVAFDFSSISTPYDLLINSTTFSDESVELKNIEDENIIICGDNSDITKFTANGYVRLKDADKKPITMLKNGSYQGILTDADGNITEFNFTIEGKYLSFKTEVQDFKQPNNVLQNKFQTDDEIYDAIAGDVNGKVTNKDTKQVTREIGGVITLHSFFINGKEIENYKVEITPQKTIDGYDGVTFKKQSCVSEQGTEVTDEDEDGISNHGIHVYCVNGETVYGIGVPKGGVAYNIVVTELCTHKKDNNTVEIVDSSNVVKRVVMVNEPIPYKMFINDVDYDLIKNFNKIGDKYSDGWTPKGKITDKKAVLQDNRKVIFANNPWFNLNNIWSKEKFKTLTSLKLLNTEDVLKKYATVGGINTFISDVNNRRFIIESADKDKAGTFDLGELLNEFAQETVGGGEKVYYTWSGNYIAKDYNVNTSFQYESKEYNDDNIDDVVNELNEFIDIVNDIIPLRNELPSLVRSTFYLTCTTEQKDITVSVQTSDMPGVVTFVYQQETAVEDGDGNILTTNNMVVSNESTIDNINIPTITYACNEQYGIVNSTSYDPVVAEYVASKNKKYQRHPFYVGVMNFTKQSIPNGIKHDDYNQVFKIKTSEQLSKLFDFPIIDKVLRVNYISWSYFNKIPYYKKEVEGKFSKDTVTMNGILAGSIFNGNVSANNEFDTQVLNALKIKLSDNLIKGETYVEKRIMLGYDVDDIVDLFLNFKNYIIDEGCKDDQTQYIPLLPIQGDIRLEDEEGCSFSETIYANMSIELSDEAVNNCKEHKKILSVRANNAGNGQTIYYSVINLKDTTYPLNYATNNGVITQIGEIIKDVFAQHQEYNIFSYKMTSDYFRDGANSIVDKEFTSEISEEQDDGNTKLTSSKGYGTTGVFTANKAYPVYIVAETTNHCRSLSPVYDYSYVVAIIKYGLLERLDAIPDVKYKNKSDETDIKTEEEYNKLTEEEKKNYSKFTVYQQEEEITKDYKFGIAIDGTNTKQFYLLNYAYQLSGICKLDNINVIEVNQETLSSPNSYIFTTISETLYKMIKSKYAKILTFMEDSVTKTFKKNTEVIAYDYTGLKHICDIKTTPKQTQWHSVIWKANDPSDKGICAIRENNDADIVQNIENYYETNETFEGPQVVVKDENDENEKWIKVDVNQSVGNYTFLGWNEFTKEGSECKVYVANWQTIETA